MNEYLMQALYLLCRFKIEMSVQYSNKLSIAALLHVYSLALKNLQHYVMCISFAVQDGYDIGYMVLYLML